MENGQWRVAGSYYESCNCDAVCPCRRLNGKPGRRSQFDLCQFILSWQVNAGHAPGVNLDGLKVVMVGFWDNAFANEPWSVKLYVDEKANDAQFDALSQIFLGKSGGDLHFTTFITTVFDVQRARISLDHKAGSEWVKVEGVGDASVERRADYEGTVSCGIPGHHHPGVESVSRSAIDDGPLKWSYEGRCGFATDFAYFN
jgi:hypothetical protein